MEDSQMSDMKRLIIVCEGETEQEFCNNLLFPFFFNLGVIVQAPLIKHSRGGIVSWDKLKKQIYNHLREEEVFVTSFIDYYGLPDNYPNWGEAHSIADKRERMICLEKGMSDDIGNSYRFVPYIQLHEFESLLFNEIKFFEENFNDDEFCYKEDLKRLLEEQENPELINNGKETAPSKRLERYIINYNKPLYGVAIAESIGLRRMREKCPHFNEWITKLESLAK